MQAIGQFDQDYPDVLGHGHGHLLKVLCLGFVAAGKYFAKFRHPIDNLGYRLAKFLAQSLFVGRRVFDHVVQ